MSKWQEVLQLNTNRKIVSGSEEMPCIAIYNGAFDGIPPFTLPGTSDIDVNKYAQISSAWSVGFWHQRPMLQFHL